MSGGGNKCQALVVLAGGKQPGRLVAGWLGSVRQIEFRTLLRGFRENRHERTTCDPDNGREPARSRAHTSAREGGAVPHLQVVEDRQRGCRGHGAAGPGG